MGNGYTKLVNETTESDLSTIGTQTNRKSSKRRLITFRTNARPDFVVVTCHHRTYFRPEEDQLKTSCWEFMGQVLETFKQVDRCDFNGDTTIGKLHTIQIIFSRAETSKTIIFREFLESLADLVIFDYTIKNLNSTVDFVVDVEILGIERSLSNIAPRQM